MFIKSGLAAFVVWLTFAFRTTACAGDMSLEIVAPSITNPEIHQFDIPDVVIDGKPPLLGAPLVVFLPGTNGNPQNVLPLLEVVAEQGYRVVGLSYNDAPAVVGVCAHNPDPDCAAAFRRMRVDGTGNGPVFNTKAESILSRLVALLQYLCEIACNTDPLRAVFASNPDPSALCVSISPFGHIWPGRGLGDDVCGRDRRYPARLFRAAPAD